MNYYKNGIRIDKKKLDIFCDKLEFEINYVRNILEDKLGDINFNSTKQLAEAFDRVGIRYDRKIPTTKMLERAEKKGVAVIGNPNLDEAALHKILKNSNSRIIKVLLYYRSIVKLASTYVFSLRDKIKKIDDDTWILEGYFFLHIGTRGGRLSAKNPNLQNQVRGKFLLRCSWMIDLQEKGILSDRLIYLSDEDMEKIVKDDKARTKFKKYEKEILNKIKENQVDVRALFIANKGKKLIDLDYSQLELKMMAHFSNDKKMLYAFNNDLDMHIMTKDMINQIVKHEIVDRQKSKTINFLLQYGGWWKLLAEKLGITQKTAKIIYMAYHKIYKERFDWIDKVYEQAEKSWFVQTLFGRRRNVNTIGINDYSTSGFMRRNKARNSAISHIISGSSSDLIKAAMINIFNKYDKIGYNIKIQVHDELLIEVDEDKVYEAFERIKFEMENALSLNVKIEVEGVIADNWRDAH